MIKSYCNFNINILTICAIIGFKHIIINYHINKKYHKDDALCQNSGLKIIKDWFDS